MMLRNQFIKGTQESGSKAEKIFLKDKEINYCRGCGTCFNREKGCSQKDDMGKILEKVMGGYVIVTFRWISKNIKCNQMYQ